jgi:hypothetical protein
MIPTSKVRTSEPDKKKKSKFPWHPPLTLSEVRRRYKANRFVRPGARSPLPEDIINRQKPD